MLVKLISRRVDSVNYIYRYFLNVEYSVNVARSMLFVTRILDTDTNCYADSLMPDGRKDKRMLREKDELTGSVS